MNSLSLRTILAPLAGAVVYLLVGPWPSAIGGTPLVEQLAARAVSMTGDEDAGRIGIYIERWSTDQELASLRDPLNRGDMETLLEALHKGRNRVGVVLMPGVQGHGARTRTRTPKNLLFARQTVTPAGRRVVVASDERLGLGAGQIEARREVYELTVLDIRFAPDGTGVGKVATGADVVHDPANGFGIRDYAARPARLIEVKSEKY